MPDKVANNSPDNRSLNATARSRTIRRLSSKGVYVEAKRRHRPRFPWFGAGCYGFAVAGIVATPRIASEFGGDRSRSRIALEERRAEPGLEPRHGLRYQLF
jgi:hypothetical protein